MPGCRQPDFVSSTDWFILAVDGKKKNTLAL